MNNFDIGDLVELKVTFTNDAGVPTDPTTATIRVRKPDGTETSYTGGQLTHPTPGNGIYTYNYAPTVSGQHHYFGVGTGTVTSAEEGRFYVKQQAVEQLCTIADIEQFLQLSLSNIEAAEAAIAEATAAIRNYTNQHITAVENDAVTLTVPPFRRQILLPELPVTAVASVVEDGTTLVVGDDYRWTSAGILERVGGNWDFGWQKVVVTYSHGYATIPDDVRHVCARMAARRYQAGLRSSATAGVSGIQSQTIPDYAVSYAADTQGPAGAVMLGASGAMLLLPSEKALLNRYRVRP